MAAPAHIARENGKKGGRPKGSTTRPQILDYFTEDDIKLLNQQIVNKIKEGDSLMLKWLGDQVYGKAIQVNELTGKDGGDLKVVVSGMNIIEENDTGKNNRVSNKESKADSSG